MQTITPTNLNPIVVIDHNHTMTTSLLVAEKFDKQHKNVLQSIELIIEKCPDEEFPRLNFQPRKFQYVTGRNQIREATMYEMTRDGFVMLATGFTGEKAFLWKIAFINAFNHMEQLLNTALANAHQAEVQAVAQELAAMMNALFDRHPQWRETADYTQQGFSTGQVAKLQGKAKSSVRAMKARIRAAGLDLSPTPRLH